MNNSDFLVGTKIRESILPGIFDNAGISNYSYTRYMEISDVMRPDEIHPEIKEKLDAITDHFSL